MDVAFSPNGRDLASASGDTTVRFWDILTETPIGTCQGHKNWVLVVSWSPDGLRLATGDNDGVIFLWDPSNVKAEGRKLMGHKKFITGLAWEPLHLNKDCSKMVSSSKDWSLKIWDTKAERCLHSLMMHNMCVTRVVWSGEGFIYSSSEDRTIKMWDGKGKYQKDLLGHSHWVNCLSLNFAHALRTGYWDHTLTELTDRDEMQKVVPSDPESRRQVHRTEAKSRGNSGLGVGRLHDHPVATEPDRQAVQKVVRPPEAGEPRPVLTERQADRVRVVRQESAAVEPRGRPTCGVQRPRRGRIHGLLEYRLAHVRERIEGLHHEGLGLQAPQTHVRPPRTCR